MYLEKLSLRNFKGFESIDLTFHPNMTVIVGANGAGKTSILEAAAIAVSAMFVKMDGLSARGIDKTHAHLKAYSIGSTTDVQPQYPVEVVATAETFTKQRNWKRSLNAPNGKTTIVDAKDMIDLGISLQKDLRNGNTSLVLPIIAYYRTGRLWDYHREKQTDVFEKSNRLNGYIDCVDGTANIKLMMNWFSKMTIQKYQNQELGLDRIPELEAVFSAMEACYKRITGCDDVKILYNMGSQELEVIYPDETGEKMRISINQLSDGYKSTISLVADIAYRMAVLNPQLLDNVCTKTDGIVLIDEVDLHLHPMWQQRILDDLRAIFPKVQFLVTTHAPAVISTVKSENMVMLDSGEAYEPSGEVYGKDANTIISSVMGASERKPDIHSKFKEFYSYIDASDAAEAERVLEELINEIGSNDREIASCTVKLKLLKARKAK